MVRVTWDSAAAAAAFAAAAGACGDMPDKEYGMATVVKYKPYADTGYSTEAAHSCCTCRGKGALCEGPGTVKRHGHDIAAGTPGVYEWADDGVRDMPAAHADETEDRPDLLSPCSNRKNVLAVPRVRFAIESSLRLISEALNEALGDVCINDRVRTAVGRSYAIAYCISIVPLAVKLWCCGGAMCMQVEVQYCRAR